MKPLKVLRNDAVLRFIKHNGLIVDTREMTPCEMKRYSLFMRYLKEKKLYKTFMSTFEETNCSMLQLKKYYPFTHLLFSSTVLKSMYVYYYDFFMSVFTWCNTKQGDKFWVKIRSEHNKLFYNFDEKENS